MGVRGRPERMIGDAVASMLAFNATAVHLIGDSGGNQAALARAARAADRPPGRRVVYHAAYYASVRSMYGALARRGLFVSRPPTHDDFAWQAMLCAIDPSHVRWRPDRMAGNVSMASLRWTRAMGELLLGHRVRRTLEAWDGELQGPAAEVGGVARGQRVVPHVGERGAA